MSLILSLKIIAVKLSFTPNSVEQIRNLMNGTYDLGTTAYDNVVAYQNLGDPMKYVDESFYRKAVR